MNRIAILQEMGITSWISRQEPIVSSNELLASSKQVEVKPLENEDQSNQVVLKEEFVHEVDLANALEMRWALVLDGPAKNFPLFSKIKRSIEDLGAKCQVLDISTGEITPNEIQGDIVLAFGQKAGVTLSGERDSIENIRGIVFELQNKDGEDIPLLITYHPQDLIKQPALKSMVWDDIIWTRSIWLESRL